MLVYILHDSFEIKDFLGLTIYDLGISAVYFIRQLIFPTSLTRPWDSFIQTICAKKESMKFDIVWEDCIQEEARDNKEALIKEYYQALH